MNAEENENIKQFFRLRCSRTARCHGVDAAGFGAYAGRDAARRSGDRHEAGAKITDMAGEPFDLFANRGVAVSNGKVHAEMMETTYIGEWQKNGEPCL